MMSERLHTCRRVFIVVFALSWLAACAEPETWRRADTPQVQELMQDPAALTRGQALYQGSCASYCHGLDPEDPVLNLFDCEWRHGGSDREIFDVVTRGIADTRMVGFGSNWPEGEQDLWRVIAFLRDNQVSCD